MHCSIEFRHVGGNRPEQSKPASSADRDVHAARPAAHADAYEASQSGDPGVAEAQVSRAAIAVHGLEHLVATTDHRSIMCRRRLPQVLRTVQAGRTPDGLCGEKPARSSPRMLPNDTIIHILPAATAEG